VDRNSEELVLHSLSSAFLTASNWALEKYREGQIDDFGSHWASLVASGLNGVNLCSPPSLDRNQPNLPFNSRHAIDAAVYDVLRSGARGGGEIDVLLQIQFATESARGGFGVPIIFKGVPSHGPIPNPIWDELQVTCDQLRRAAGTGFVVLISENEDFDWGSTSIVRHQPILALDAYTIARSIGPMRPTLGRMLGHFFFDLASGWLGTPALSGMSDDGMEEEFLKLFRVRNLLRVKIAKCHLP